jgi:hypothetical protein
MTPLAQIDITPIPWSEWNRVYHWLPESDPDSKTTRYCVYYSDGITHRLVELGEKTSTYRYSVYGHCCISLTKTIKLGCCGALRKCPIRHCVLPESLCRELLRERAIAAAYQAWIDFLTSLATSQP